MERKGGSRFFDRAPRREKPWRPRSAQDRAIDDQWRGNVGFRLSELGFSEGDVEILANPFRSWKDMSVFAALKEMGRVKVTLDPISPEERKQLSHLSASERSKIIAQRLGGKDGVKRFLRQGIDMLRLVHDIVDNTPEPTDSDIQEAISYFKERHPDLF